MHARKPEDRVTAHAEAGFEDTGRDGIAQQELTDALAVFVEVIDRMIVRIFETIEAGDRVAEFGVDEEQFGIGRRLAVFVGDGEEGFE
jgi:hypothetical protein